MKKSKKMLAGATLAIGVIAPQVMPTTAHADENTGESTVKLRILETSDIHVNLMNYDYYQTKTDNKVGLVQTATLVNKAREEVKNSVLFDDGDALQGTPLGDYVANTIKDSKNRVDPSYTHPLYRVMNLMKYDVISLGNHEFNYGLDYLNKVIEKTDFPVINSNVYKVDHDDKEENDENYFKPYHILKKEVVDEAGQKQIVKIGVMGFVPPQIMNWDKANLEGKVKAKDIVATAKIMVKKMQNEGADIIVALAHSGVDKSEYKEVNKMENASYHLATQVPGVDAVLMGHSHTEVKDVFNGVPVVMPGVFGSNLGIIDMQLKKVNGKWEVQKDQSKPQLRPIANSKGTPLVESDQKLVNEIKDEHQATIDYVNTPVGTTKAPINSYFSLVQDDPSVQIVTNAQKWYVEQELKKPEYEEIKDIPVLSAGAPFKAGGRNGATYYTDIPAGTLAIKNVADLYVYPNTLYAVKVNGAQVKEWLEMSAGQFNQIDPKKTEEQPLVNIGYPTYNFDILDGLKYEIDVTQPAKYDKDGKVVNANTNRIVNMTYEGKPVADDQKFIVATNNYRGSSQTFPGVSEGEVVYQSQDETRQIIVKYMQKIKNIDPAADQNWTFKPIVADKLNTTFDSSPNAQKYIKKDGNISYVGPSENEFAKYAIDITKKNDDKETGGENPTTPPTGEGNNGENPTTPPTGEGNNGGNPTTPPTGEGNNGGNPTTPPKGEGNNGGNPTTPPTGEGNNAGSGQTTTDDQNTKETTTTVSENKEAEKDERDLPKTGASIASTIGAGLAFVGAGLLMLFRRKKANR
ncbi:MULTISPECIES: bifunctional 2',3'-cyclic-nucleotide 2'-phosphodiesterase/3'-nucleotidase [Bacillus cereus group]|uniref:Bifunctional 2',3'-cyclic-nucleotide 2'-phosphodiesterase/3'-nucleotidase n=1 Tax=Bacillus thuringiensis TaxID=1428 RepID=A0A9X7GB51_BACTU|nr:MULTISPECIES: bifunctional 2',3'-cyclic-nucleotide 2'-phosphodiesterase/3'-nucleotidase [Bacillus cereus group]MBZ3762393.1 bifunctional 2',3'-cyclic-nucleotide 2'-phosphodiesterase/3'-nucleotidase [Bacillus cereus]PEE64156.1 bifunctional 2',3'-cyclic-nucleotide 2'-phosphodiesterase/3'-nucleotidase [Bacillus thuringiensis]PEE89676.1 bifunctional 2',3'-cyclic-nucleotide 2'-phosphodiesterase/3'-nucleotidase [Bacillus thuringiensis]PET21922.1 bifunctional 2',3'-cyclic-nucleotide 2'-phosphodiest